MSPPELPVELVDDIIDEASRTLDASSVSSIALTSHTFRIHANKARFSSLVPFRNYGHNIEHTAKGIRTLAEVLKNGNAIDTMPGVGAFATSFSLEMIGYYDEVTPALDDGCLAYIFDNLFRPCPAYTPSSAAATRSLSLYVYRWSHRDDDDYDDPRYNGLRWYTINSELLKALTNLLRFSQLNRLRLVEMHNIPRDFLQGSGVRHLCLSYVSIHPFMSYYDLDNMPPEDPVILESLDIEGSVSPGDIGLIVYPYSNLPVLLGNMLPYLTDLSIYIPYASIFKNLNEILHNTPALQSLSVRLWMDTGFSRDDCTIHYSHLEKLRSLTIRSLSTTPASLISHLLTHNLPPNLADLRLAFVLHNTDPPRAVAARLDNMDIGDLDDHLMHPSFDSLTRIGVALEVELFSSYEKYQTPNYLAQWRTQLARKFPLLLEKNAGMQILVRWKD